jgi:hypothetical protein
MNAGSLHHPQMLARPGNRNPVGAAHSRVFADRSTAMAMAVAQHIEALCAHPDYRGSWEERCAYRRLARHWNGLAWIESP